MVKVNKLKYPKVFTIIFYILTVAIPLGKLLAVGLTAESSKFKVTFSVVVMLLIWWLLVNKFLIKGIKLGLISRQQAIEHDYSIGNGDKDVMKKMWYTNELKLVAINIVTLILIALVLIILLIGIEMAAVDARGLIVNIITLYVLAYSIKLIVVVYWVFGGVESD